MTAAPSSHARVHACLECGGAHQKGGAFCCNAHRDIFNNRRKQRGAELYDLYMAFRFERPLARMLGLFQAMNRLAAMYRADDRAERGGRVSWRSPRAVLEERPYLKAFRTTIRSGR